MSLQSDFTSVLNHLKLKGNTHKHTPLGLAGACHCSWTMSSLSSRRRQWGGATPHGFSSGVVTVVMWLEPRPKLFQPLSLYWYVVKGSRSESTRVSKPVSQSWYKDKDSHYRHQHQQCSELKKTNTNTRHQRSIVGYRLPQPCVEVYI